MMLRVRVTGAEEEAVGEEGDEADEPLEALLSAIVTWHGVERSAAGRDETQEVQRGVRGHAKKTDGSPRALSRHR